MIALIAMLIRCDVCRRDFARDLDRGCLAWAFTPTRPYAKEEDPRERVWICCSEQCAAELGELPQMLVHGALSTLTTSLSAPVACA